MVSLAGIFKVALELGRSRGKGEGKPRQERALGGDEREEGNAYLLLLRWKINIK